MKPITILDTSIATTNLGDEIIADGVKKELNGMFGDKSMFLSVPTHEKIGRHSRKIINKSQYSFVAGTNLLNSKYRLVRTKPWKLNLLEASILNNVILMGVGWGDYQGDIQPLAKFFYKQILDSNKIHSVRDNYTKEKLESIGISNVINTGCATMWKLTPEHCMTIPTSKAQNVVFTLTDYNKDPLKDQKLIDILVENYKKVFFWIQGSRDFEYIQSLNFKNVEFIGPSLNSYDKLLESNIDLDYVGTRLHAGIRAMQKKRRSIIIGIDNRAIEKKKDFNINVVERKDIETIADIINNKVETKLTLDFNKINQWKKQFLS